MDYAFDYSVIGAPSAPNSVGGTTIGVAMETNLTDQCPGDPNCVDPQDDEGEGVAIIPLSAMGQIPDGDFRLTTDAYMFWNLESGSTEYLTIGVYSQGTASPLRFNLDSGDGLAWQFDGEGGSGTDILRFEGPGGGETSLGEWEDFPCDPDFTFNIGEPGVCFPGNQLAGPANQWIEVAVESVDGMVSLSVDGLLIDTYDNTDGFFSGGSLMIGQSDPFNSVNPPDANGNTNMVVFDNIALNVLSQTNGDFDADGDYDCDDIDSLVAEIAAGTNDSAFDLTGEGDVDGNDLTAWLSEAGAANLASGEPYIPGDANLDGSVDVADFNVWNGNKFTSVAAWCSGDFNADGSVDVGDFNIWNGNKFTSADLATVPEPSGLLLLCFGLVTIRGLRGTH